MKNITFNLSIATTIYAIALFISELSFIAYLLTICFCMIIFNYDKLTTIINNKINQMLWKKQLKNLQKSI